MPVGRNDRNATVLSRGGGAVIVSIVWQKVENRRHRQDLNLGGHSLAVKVTETSVFTINEPTRCHVYMLGNESTICPNPPLRATATPRALNPVISTIP